MPGKSLLGKNLSPRLFPAVFYSGKNCCLREKILPVKNVFRAKVDFFPAVDNFWLLPKNPWQISHFFPGKKVFRDKSTFFPQTPAKNSQLFHREKVGGKVFSFFFPILPVELVRFKPLKLYSFIFNSTLISPYTRVHM